MSRFEARNIDFDRRVRESFNAQSFMHTLGASISQLEPGRCEVALAFNEALCQQHGFFHGGVVASLADVSAGYAAFSLFAADRAVLTVEFKLSLVAPGVGDRLVAEGVVIKSGKTLTTCRSDVFALEGRSKTLCATALVTLMAVDDR